MKKIGIGVLAAAGLMGASAPSAGAEVGPPKPCETQRALFEKYNIEFGMHQEEVEAAYTWTCSQTG